MVEGEYLDWPLLKKIYVHKYVLVVHVEVWTGAAMCCEVLSVCEIQFCFSLVTNKQGDLDFQNSTH